MVKIKLNNFSCFALCNVGASTSVMPRRMYDMLELKPFDPCSFDYVPVDFTIMDIECEPSCPIILGCPFLRIVGAVIDMKEGNIRFQFPLKKGMEHFPRKKLSYLLSPLHGLAILLHLIKLDLFSSCLAQRSKRKRLLGGNQFFSFCF